MAESGEDGGPVEGEVVGGCCVGGKGGAEDGEGFGEELLRGIEGGEVEEMGVEVVGGDYCVVGCAVVVVGEGRERGILNYRQRLVQDGRLELKCVLSG